MPVVPGLSAADPRANARSDASPAAWHRRLLRLARVRGLRRSARAFAQAYLFARRRWYLFYRPAGSAPAPPGASDFECRLATLDDLESFAVFEPNRKRREFRAWLEGDALLFAAFVDGRPVAFQCLARSVPTGPPLSSLVLQPGQLWTVDVQTLPEYRRQHAAASLRAHRDHVLVGQGVREYVSSVQDDNLPTLRYAWGTDRRLVERVSLLSYFCLLGFRRIRIERDALARLERMLVEKGLLPAARS